MKSTFGFSTNCLVFQRPFNTFCFSGEQGETGFNGGPGLKGYPGDPGYYGNKGPKGFRGLLTLNKSFIM